MRANPPNVTPLLRHGKTGIVARRPLLDAVPLRLRDDAAPLPRPPLLRPRLTTNRDDVTPRRPGNAPHHHGTMTGQVALTLGRKCSVVRSPRSHSTRSGVRSVHLLLCIEGPVVTMNVIEPPPCMTLTDLLPQHLFAPALLPVHVARTMERRQTG